MKKLQARYYCKLYYRSKVYTASEATKEAVWIHKFIQELEVVPSIESTITIYCDNNGAIANTVEPRAHQRTKHIARIYHLIGDIIHRGDVTITKIASANNVVEPLTKALSQKVFEKHLEAMRLNTCMIDFECKWKIVRIICPQKQYYAFLFDNKLYFHIHNYYWYIHCLNVACDVTFVERLC